MRNSAYIKVLFFLPLLGTLMGIDCRSSAEQPDFKSRLEREIKRSRIKPDELGVVVAWFQAGKSMRAFGLNSDKPMIPASLTKIITAGAALENFGPSHKFETHLLADANIENGVLKGDLYLKGGGDPGFVSESMWFLVNELTRSGIHQIEGGIVVDDSRFDAVRTDSSRQAERVDRAFDAPVGAMSFNWNSINIYVRPGGKEGAPANVILDPENSYTQLKATAKTTKGGGKNLAAEREAPAHGQVGDLLNVSGNIGKEAPEAVIYKNITEPDLWSGYNLVGFLKQRGIVVNGKVRTGLTPATAKDLAKAESKPLGQLVTDMMKFSNNFVAEMLTKNLAAEKVGQPAKLEDGMKLLRNFVTDMGVPADRFKLVNPSGFSRENKIWPSDLHEILVRLQRRFSFFAENISAYPLAGVDGTLKSRMKGTAAEGHIRAKTGLLNGVAGLAGYAGRPDGTLLTFVFIFNGRADRSEDARSLFDQMAVQLVQ